MGLPRRARVCGQPRRDRMVVGVRRHNRWVVYLEKNPEIRDVGVD